MRVSTAWARPAGSPRCRRRPTRRSWAASSSAWTRASRCASMSACTRASSWNTRRPSARSRSPAGTSWARAWACRSGGCSAAGLRSRLSAYANGWYTCPREPAAFAECALRVKEMGYTALKFDPFGTAYLYLEPAEERLSLAIVRAVRDAVGEDVDVLIEGHDRFSLSTAVRIGRALEEFAPDLVRDARQLPGRARHGRGGPADPRARRRRRAVALSERVRRPAGPAHRLDPPAGAPALRRRQRGDEGGRPGPGARGRRRLPPGAEPADHRAERAHARRHAELHDPGVLRRLPGALGARC